jgi:hypothetical protein
MSDAPIKPEDFRHGVKVVDIGDLRVARGLTRRPHCTCLHRKLVYDTKERRIWCEDCESEVEPFDAFAGLVEFFDGASKKLERRQQELKDAEQAAARSLAVKALDKIWRSRTRAPLCPHCDEALLPEDMTKGLAQASRELIRARRRKQAAQRGREE